MDRIEKLLEMLRTSPEDAFLKHALALEYIKTGDEMKARSYFESLLTTDPDYTGSYYHLAQLYIRIGEPALALKTFENGMEACKRNSDKHALSELRMAYEDFIDE